MSPEERSKRQRRAETEPLIIAETEAGFRVHSPLSSGGPYLVTGLPDIPACTCPDFQHHADDPEWRCKHVLAVLNRRTFDAGPPPSQAEPRRARTREEKKGGAEDCTTSGDDTARMTLKRSVSPDGRIDSLSVELSAPVEGRTADDIAAGAAAILKIQDRIVSRFLAGSAGNGGNGRTGSTAPRTPPPPAIQPGSGNGHPSHDEAVPAELVGIRGADGKWGRRLYMTVRTNGRYLRLYGSQSKLADHLTHAGYPAWAGNVREGVNLSNLPCRIVTKTSDDGYVSVERVLPAGSR